MSARLFGQDQLDDAAGLLLAGQVLAVPTDTVYGLAARLADRAAVAELAALKGRPASMPVAVLCSTLEEARDLASSWPEDAAVLAEALWPGPLTIVVPASTDLASAVGAVDSVGLRVPNDAVCRGLLARTGPLAVTSANLHGDSPAATALEVLKAFDGTALAGVVDGGSRSGAVSSVIDVSGREPTVLREGALTRAALLDLLTRG